MPRVFAVCFALLLAACGIASVTDRYGNSYGDWYNPGGNFSWQLGVCERQMEQQNVPMDLRKLAMRCCMRNHGVPISDPESCSA